MIQWLQNYTGTGIHGVNVEKNELQNLRKEIKHYKKKYEKEDKEIMILSDNEEKESKEDQEKIDEQIKKKQQKNRQARQTICDEVLPEKDMSSLINFKPQLEEKSSEIFEKLQQKCQNLTFFSKLSESELSLIINAFITENKNKGETIFSQGEDADKLYILEDGELDCWKIFRKGDPETYIKSYKKNDSFGELALIYNYKRNYTVKAKTKVVLFSLDRRTYKGIIQGEEINKRERYKIALKKVDILQNLTVNEFGKICDIMSEVVFQAGEEIMNQENEDDFCILYEGKCHSEKISDSGKPPQTIKEFEEYEYFGEPPWFKYEQRNYIVKADTDCVVFCISRKKFKRLLGPLENILKRKIDSYQKFMKK